MSDAKRVLLPISDPFEGEEEDAAAWLASRPDQIKALAAEFPMGSVVTDLHGDDWYVIGWNEDDGVIISPIWPGDDYDASIAAKGFVHAEHLRDGTAQVKIKKGW